MSAVRVQTSKWEETKDLEEVARAGETSEVESTDDEKEIPDPKTDSEKIDARHKNRLEAKTKGNTKGKETAGSKGGARTKGNGKRKRQVVEDENTESHGEVLKPAARRRQKVWLGVVPLYFGVLRGILHIILLLGSRHGD